MSTSQMRHLYNVHKSKMISEGIKPLSYVRFMEILSDLGF